MSPRMTKRGNSVRASRRTETRRAMERGARRSTRLPAEQGAVVRTSRCVGSWLILSDNTSLVPSGVHLADVADVGEMDSAAIPSVDSQMGSQTVLVVRVSAVYMSHKCKEWTRVPPRAVRECGEERAREDSVSGKPAHQLLCTNQICSLRQNSFMHH